MGWLRQAKRLAEEDLTWEEMKEILDRAAQLQAEAERRDEGERKRRALWRGARAAGIDDGFLNQAFEEFRQRRRQLPETGKKKQWVQKAVTVIAVTAAVIFGLFLLGSMGGMLTIFGTVIIVAAALVLLMVPLIVLAALMSVPVALLIALVSVLKAVGSLLRFGRDDDD